MVKKSPGSGKGKAKEAGAPVKVKKPKKLTKKERARLAVQQAEELRVAAEVERLRLEKEETVRQERERIAADIKAKREVEEQAVREVQLAETQEVLKRHMERMMELELELRAKEEWLQYLKCDGLPDPAHLGQVNTYLYTWRLEDKGYQIGKVVTKTTEVIGILSVLEELIDYPLNKTPSHVENWKQIRNSVRVEQQAHLDVATYLLLRHMHTDMTLEGLNTARYGNKCDHFSLYLWALVPLPEPTQPSEDIVGLSPDCDFPELGVHIHMPIPLSETYLAIRALRLHYDHLSDLCPSWGPRSIPDDASVDLLSALDAEAPLLAALQLPYERALVERQAARRARLQPFDSPGGPVFKLPHIDLTRQLHQPLATYLIPLIPPELDTYIPTPYDLIGPQQEEGEVALRKLLLYAAEKHEVNLRRFAILGGVLHIDLLEQPPQPVSLEQKFVLTTLNVPKRLTAVDFHVPYMPPPPPEPGQRRLPEEIEAEMKQQEAALDKLCLVSVTLPEKVLWFEPPIVVGWDDKKNYWSTENYHDQKFNEEKQILTFRTGRLGPLGLAVYRYANLPYQGWELKPDHKSGGVSLVITATIAVIEFIFKEDRVCVSQLQNGATSALQDIVGVYYKPRKLIRLLTEGGVDIFPAADAVCYVEGVTTKHRACEQHLYHCLALLATSYNFAWSRWNLLAGYRSIVLQMREFLDRRKLPPYSMLHVTPLKACVVDCTEVGPVFVEEGVAGMKFYSDLYHLVKAHGSAVTKTKMADVSFRLVETLCEMLIRIKPLSFS